MLRSMELHFIDISFLFSFFFIAGNGQCGGGDDVVDSYPIRSTTYLSTP